MRSVNLDHLRTLIEVIDRGSFSSAARQLNLTQPAVSLHIRALEERFGVDLIERAGKSTTAAPAGLELASHARAIFESCERAASSMKRYREGWVGRVSLVTTLTTLNYRLPPVLKHLQQVAPGVELLVSNMPTRDVVEKVARREADFGFVMLPIPESRLKVTRLCAEEIVAIFPRRARDIPDVVTPEFVARAPLIMEHTRGSINAFVEQWLARANLTVDPTMRIGNIEAIKTLVAAGLGMSIVPLAAIGLAGKELACRPLRPEIKAAVGLVENEKAPRNKAADMVRPVFLQLRNPPARTKSRATE
ncbi:LysR family transcriptional regulator [Terrarubrum flagellatum]|uniref:LysR family transcriptional regulator n=1 Tax=Terrirubrum flagellatum TaxID=2895980 RepID=UPI00314555B5